MTKSTNNTVVGVVIGIVVIVLAIVFYKTWTANSSGGAPAAPPAAVSPSPQKMMGEYQNRARMTPSRPGFTMPRAQ